MKRLVLAGVVLLIAAALIQFPAQWIAPEIARATGERWRVGAVSGTIWRGEATIYALNRVTGYWYPGRGIHWHVIWPDVVKGVLAAQVAFDDGGTAYVSAGLHGWSVERLSADFPAVQMAALLPSALANYGWSGTLTARAESFRCNWRRPVCTGQMDLAWSGAGTAQIPGPPLGDYRVRMTAEGEALRFDVKTDRGRLQITGSGDFTAGKVRFNGEAAASGEDAPRLENLLRTIGRPGSAPGRYLIDYQELRTG